MTSQLRSHTCTKRAQEEKGTGTSQPNQSNRRPGGFEPLSISGPTGLKPAPTTSPAQSGPKTAQQETTDTLRNRQQTFTRPPLPLLRFPPLAPSCSRPAAAVPALAPPPPDKKTENTRACPAAPPRPPRLAHRPGRPGRPAPLPRQKRCGSKTRYLPFPSDRG
jgi:hypothetical protein